MRVRIVADWSNFVGWCGEVIEWHRGYAMVLLDGEVRALRFGFGEFEPC